jgi:hypothetical protein
VVHHWHCHIIFTDYLAPFGPTCSLKYQIPINIFNSNIRNFTKNGCWFDVCHLFKLTCLDSVNFLFMHYYITAVLWCPPQYVSVFSACKTLYSNLNSIMAKYEWLLICYYHLCGQAVIILVSVLWVQQTWLSKKYVVCLHDITTLGDCMAWFKLIYAQTCLQNKVIRRILVPDYYIEDSHH